jgi:hypothetical protein
MTITIDMLQSYQPVLIGSTKYWKMGSKLYIARINSFGLVEIQEAPETDKIKESA